MVSRLATLLLLVFALFPSLSAQAIRFDSRTKVWLLSTSQSSYALGVSSTGQLQHLYWGAPLARIEDLAPASPHAELSSFDPNEMQENEEYPGWGGKRFYEPALKITAASGNRDLVLHYRSHRQTADTLDITLADIEQPVEVVLHYRVHPGSGILQRSATIYNRTSAILTLESAQSATWYPPRGDHYQLSYLSGRWAAETQLNREPVHEGAKVLESRLGHTGHNLNPWFALSTPATTEENGSVWFGALAWSGNWRIAIEQTPYQQVRVTGGFNSFDFSYPLQPGQSLETPAFYAGFTDAGFGAASRLLHTLERSEIAPQSTHARLRPVLYNSWEATGFDVDLQGQVTLAEKAAKLGVELFVMDDGWFGKRNSDNAGLGDWVVNPAKFPKGLRPLIERVNNLGMDFGLWVEPEMVNPDSDLYRAHPDWVMNFPSRPRSQLRNQLVLNLARDDVRDHLIEVLDKLLTENKIRYLKWDMNRIFSEPGWPEQDLALQKTLWVRYVNNLYRIFDVLRSRHPLLEIESCSGGGGRIDLAILPRVEDFWTSDNTEAFDRLGIQNGFTQAYAPKFMSAWVTDVPNMNGRSTPLKFRFLVAMQGALGIGANLNKWTADDTSLATNLVALDKRIRNTVQNGDLYRLLSPQDPGGVTSNQYVAADGKQALLFVFRHSQQYGTLPPIIYLRGLDPAATYSISLIDKSLIDSPTRLSGAYLMRHGLQLQLKGDYDSTLLVLDRAP